MKKNTILLIMALVILPAVLLAQVENWVFRYGEGDTVNYFGGSMAYGLDDNIYVAGGSVIISITATGDTNWVTHFDTIPYAYAMYITYGLDNNLYAAGGNAVFSLTTNGDINWVCQLPPCDIYALICGADSNIYVGGEFDGVMGVVSISDTGTINWIYGYPTSQPDNYIYDVLYVSDSSLFATGSGFIVFNINSSTGDTNWTYTYTGNGDRVRCAYSLARDSSMSIYAAGYSEGIYGDDAMTVVCFNEYGGSIPIWTYRYQPEVPTLPFLGRVIDIVCGIDNNLYTTGEGFDTLDDWANITVTRFAYWGDTAWTYFFGEYGNWDEIAKAITYGLDSNIYVCGDCRGGAPKIGVISVTSAGEENWVYLYNEPNLTYDRVAAIAYGNDGNIYVSGYGVDIEGDSSWDLVVISLNPLAGIEEKKQLTLKFSRLQVYPNPARDCIRISSCADENTGAVHIYDACGRLVKKWDEIDLARTSSAGLAIDAIPEGVYFIELESDKNKYVNKFVILR